MPKFPPAPVYFGAGGGFGGALGVESLRIV